MSLNCQIRPKKNWVLLGVLQRAWQASHGVQVLQG